TTLRTHRRETLQHPMNLIINPATVDAGDSVFPKWPVNGQGGTRKGVRHKKTIYCEHNDSTHFYMYWYKQGSKKDMQLLVFSSAPESEAIEPPFDKSKYSTQRPVVTKFSLQIKKPVAEDSAVQALPLYRNLTQKVLALISFSSMSFTDPQKEIRGPVVEVLPPSEAELCKKKKKDNVTLLCVAKNFYPDHVYVSWEIDNDVKREKTKDVPIEKDGNYIISSRLRVPKKDWKSGKKFTCIVYYYNGTGYEPFQDRQISPSVLPVGFTLQRALTAKLAYAIFVAKSFFYGFFILILVKKRVSVLTHDH
uniref:Ig-like domain-containing protein n=1 Tax=Denticeps clupeoides TaxID=299321 RepID=A0AAY4AED8_9TELE